MALLLCFSLPTVADEVTVEAMAAFTLRIAGFDNVVVMQSGLLGWLDHAAYKP